MGIRSRTAGATGLRLFVVRVGGVAPCGLRRGVEPFNTDGMDSVLKAAGFERSDFRDVASLQAGDVVWADGHTEIYMGDGEFVGAHWDERHGVEGGRPATRPATRSA